jgi:hypothetical protein
MDNPSQLNYLHDILDVLERIEQHAFAIENALDKLVRIVEGK